MAINQYTLDGKFVRSWESPKEAADDLGFDASHISKVCRGDRKSHQGFVWKYDDSDDDFEDEEEPFSPQPSDFRNDPLFKEFLEFRRGKIENIKFKPGVHFVLGCVHVPFHNKKFFNAMLDLAEDLSDELAGLHLIGDFMDINSLSGHERGKVPIDGVTLEWEYEGGNLALDALDSVFDGDIDKNYLFGNHEDRYFRHMKDVNNSKYGGALISPTKGLRLKERGYTVLEDWINDRIYLGRFLELTHGEFVNIHSAKKHIDTYRTSIMFAHTHRCQTYIEGNCGGYNIGWMGNIDSKAFQYASRGMKERWNNGFAVVQIDEDGYYFVSQILWQNNKFCYNGKEYK